MTGQGGQPPAPLLVLLSVLIAATIGNWLGGTFGAFIAALLAIPTAASLQIAVREIWNAMPDDPAVSADARTRLIPPRPDEFERTWFYRGSEAVS